MGALVQWLAVQEVLGGAAPLAKVPPLVHARIFGAAGGTPILRHLHGDSSGVRGAAWLWPED